MKRTSCITGVVVQALVAMLGCGDDANCKPDEAACDGTCYATAIDPANCGACGNVCDPGFMCVASQCMAPTPDSCPAATPLMCGSACVDPSADEANCGACDHACTALEQCVASTCDGPLAVLQTGKDDGDGDINPRDAFVVQDGTLALIELASLAAGPIVDHLILPDGRIVIAGFVESATVSELYLVSPRDGSVTKLTPPMPVGSGVERGIVASRDGSKILYRADQQTAEVIELFVVSVASPGTSTKVNGTLVANGGVDASFALSADGHRAVYVASEDSTETADAYTVDLSTATPGAATKIDGTGQNVLRVDVSGDGTKAVFTNANGGLFEVDVAAPTVQNTIADGGEGFPVVFALTSDAVVYDYGGALATVGLFRATLATPTTSDTLVARAQDGPSDVARDFVVSADGAQVYYRTQARTDNAGTLLRLDVAAPETPTVLSPQTGGSDDKAVDFTLSRDEHTLAFRAGVDGAEGGFPPFAAPSLYTLDLTTALAVPVRVTPPRADGHQGVLDGYVATTGGRVIYRADEDTVGIIDAYLASAATAGVPHKVSPPLTTATDSDTVAKITAYK